MVKIFIGNLPQEADTDELQALFSQYGAVTECAIIKNFAFVHMEDRKSATKAIRNLHLYKLHGTPINVEASHGKNQGPVKLHVANVEKGCDDELRALFEEYGTVSECAVIKNFAFVHMANSEEAMDVIKGLDNSDFQGKRIHVQISKSRPRGEEEEEYGQAPPDRAGYWPPRFPGERPEPGPPGYFRGRFSHPVSHGHGYPPAPPPPPPPPPRRAPYPDRSASYERERERDSYGVVDYYEKYRARPYGITSYEERRVSSIPPPPPASLLRHHEGAPSVLCPRPLRASAPPAAGLLVLRPGPQSHQESSACARRPRWEWVHVRALPPLAAVHVQDPAVRNTTHPRPLRRAGAAAASACTLLLLTAPPARTLKV
ncbi:hypothetical protein SKAU_G00364780 [Synaphobranchus kaupii]|uniref:RRM domain-containing protein n=1 Tax=Synaphobranchus kaupii TaxID=118154 RepID=A0A9Q1EEV6_SYNKA|nr:hypothetical protein SKAU_G00364780 [Synaphobranchus kaupii]